jgi:hypothetical protein
MLRRKDSIVKANISLAVMEKLKPEWTDYFVNKGEKIVIQ